MRGDLVVAAAGGGLVLGRGTTVRPDQKPGGVLTQDDRGGRRVGGLDLEQTRGRGQVGEHPAR